jgi:hypothetical protein
MSAHEAAHIISDKPIGYFTIRYSKSQPGSFAVTFKDSKEEIRHSLLYPVEPNGFTLKNPPQVFKTLKEFVMCHSAKLKKPIGNPYMEQLSPQGIQSPTRFFVSDETFQITSPPSRPFLPHNESTPRPTSPTATTTSTTPPNTNTNTNTNTPSGTETSTNDKNICVVCMDAPRNTVFLECGHVACCRNCSKRLVECPICRQKIVRVVDIFNV